MMKQYSKKSFWEKSMSFEKKFYKNLKIQKKYENHKDQQKLRKTQFERSGSRSFAIFLNLLLKSSTNEYFLQLIEFK